jgi:beta-glucosidase-like glycosyl hydrolase
MSIDAEWVSHACRKNTAISVCHYAWCFAESENIWFMKSGKQIGLDLKSVGIHYNLAPLADINNNRIIQLLGTVLWTKQRKVSDLLEYLRGMNDVGILGCLKHFPGHGNTNVDSHLGLPVLKT